MDSCDFKVNDTVVYGTQGVCKITDKTVKEFLGEKKDYFVLSPVSESTSTIFVPTENKVLFSKMKHIMTADEICSLINKVSKVEPEWVENDAERKKLYSEILASGDREKIIMMIRGIKNHRTTQKEKGKKLHIADDYYLKNAENLLFDEFALVLDIRRDEVMPFILNQANNSENS